MTPCVPRSLALRNNLLDGHLVGLILVDGIGQHDGQSGLIRIQIDAPDVQEDVGVRFFVDREIVRVCGPSRIHRAGEGQHDLVRFFEPGPFDEIGRVAPADQKRGDQQNERPDCCCVFFHVTILALPAAGRVSPHN